MPQPKLTLSKLVTSAKFLLYGAASAAFGATILGFAGSQWWLFELLDHPRPQYCLILVFALVVGGISHQVWSFVWCIPLVLNLVLIVPLFFSSAQGSNLAQANPTQAPTLRLLHANLDRHNQDTTKAIQYLESQDVDLLLLQEVTPRWLNDLQSNLSRYQVVKALPLGNSQGLAMLVPITPSKPLEVLGTQIIHLPADSDRPLLETTLRWGGKEVTILSLSIIRPQSIGSSAYQDVEFDAVANWSRKLQESDREVVVIGDFNSTPWSGRFRKLLRESRLRNSQRGFGLQPTWLAGLPPVLMIAIDHCLHSDSLATINRGTGSNIGSDHLPLFVELQRA